MASAKTRSETCTPITSPCISSTALLDIFTVKVVTVIPMQSPTNRNVNRASSGEFVRVNIKILRLKQGIENSSAERLLNLWAIKSASQPFPIARPQQSRAL